MRVAVTGTHGIGKTTLIEDFVETHRDYEREEEPYWGLAQQGVAFADGASLPDLEEQLVASAELILARAGDANVVFDRCPIDFIAYAEVVGEQQGIDWAPSGKVLRRIEQALAALDLLVFIPLTRPDEISIAIELPKLRAKVDARLKSILRDDALGVLEGTGLRVVEISGSRPQRAQELARAVKG
jgi:hypothetical protein